MSSSVVAGASFSSAAASGRFGVTTVASGSSVSRSASTASGASSACELFEIITVSSTTKRGA